MKYLTLLLMLAVAGTCHAQIDTVKVELLISDTSHYFSEDGYRIIWHKDAQCKDSSKCLGHLARAEKVDKGRNTFWGSNVYSVMGYAVREKHNTSEGVIDPGFSWCFDKRGNRVSCYSDYYIEKKYLTKDKKEIPKTTIVWQVKYLQ